MKDYVYTFFSGFNIDIPLYTNPGLLLIMNAPLAAFNVILLYLKSFSELSLTCQHVLTASCEHTRKVGNSVFYYFIPALRELDDENTSLLFLTVTFLLC